MKTFNCVTQSNSHHCDSNLSQEKLKKPAKSHKKTLKNHKKTAKRPQKLSKSPSTAMTEV
jgi:hypothetical protein